jgi:hypothetical protein
MCEEMINLALICIPIWPIEIPIYVIRKWQSQPAATVPMIQVGFPRPHDLSTVFHIPK